MSWKEDFIREIEENLIDLHSFVVMEQGEFVGEHYWYPHNENTLHRMYSVSKSFVSLAIGKLIGKGKLALSDPIVPIFREELGLGELHEYLERMTLRDCLMMSGPYTNSMLTDADLEWVKKMFTFTPTHPCGTLYRYDSGLNYLLCAIVQRLSGQGFMDYLRPEFDEIGISKEAYCQLGPDGEQRGTSCVLATTRDLAKVANLLLNGGRHKGKQLLPAEYVREATRMQICNFDDGESNPWNKGYGYQIWIGKDNAFFFNGMGGQLTFAFPERDLVFACTADIQGNMSGKHIIIDALYRHILPHFPKKREIASLCPVPTATLQEEISGVTYGLNENPMGIKQFTFTFEGKKGILRYLTARGEKEIAFGIGEYADIRFPDRYHGDKLCDEAQKIRYRCLSKAEWVEPHKLMIRVNAIDTSVGNLTMVFSFKGDEVGVKMRRHAQFLFDEYSGFAGGKRI